MDAPTVAGTGAFLFSPPMAISSPTGAVPGYTGSKRLSGKEGCEVGLAQSGYMGQEQQKTHWAVDQD
ncbi:hypothetical protein GUJ93_ZPchr0001g32672 [Zizania palustris]|uniref:Uncharacterized protein n=1 Tax=Zizania palustris TaxID=103762 RepID=A0A8J5V6Y9_ZIZPA|nr:hypothetical protein GUJ93_ZPchr0001g32672 [Zizania palustris]